MLRDTHKRRGHSWHDNWMRDIQICHLIVLACRKFGVLPTRNRAARRANSTPSGISIVVAGLARHGIHRDESSIQQNLWYSLSGELVRAILLTPLQAEER